MKTIWKYPLANLTKQIVGLPEGAEILAVAQQGEKVCIWALVSPTAPIVGRTIIALTTGEPWNFYGIEAHIGTVLLDEGAYVLHYFEEKQ